MQCIIIVRPVVTRREPSGPTPAGRHVASLHSERPSPGPFGLVLFLFAGRRCCTGGKTRPPIDQLAHSDTKAEKARGGGGVLRARMDRTCGTEERSSPTGHGTHADSEPKVLKKDPLATIARSSKWISRPRRRASVHPIRTRVVTRVAGRLVVVGRAARNGRRSGLRGIGSPRDCS